MFEIILLSFQSDLLECSSEITASEERGRRAVVEAAKLADELRHEQERAQQLERFKKQLESQVKVSIRESATAIVELVELKVFVSSFHIHRSKLVNVREKCTLIRN